MKMVCVLIGQEYLDLRLRTAFVSDPFLHEADIQSRSDHNEMVTYGIQFLTLGALNAPTFTSRRAGIRRQTG